MDDKKTSLIYRIIRWLVRLFYPKTKLSGTEHLPDEASVIVGNHTQMIGPIVEEIAQEREDVTVGKINVDEEMELAVQFGVASIPTLVVMDKGQVENKAIGYRPKADIEKLL